MKVEHLNFMISLLIGRVIISFCLNSLLRDCNKRVSFHYCVSLVHVDAGNVPEVSASMLFCIFMASRTTTVSPVFTLSPTFTLISLIVPGRGATTGLPEAAAAAGLVVVAELAFVAEEELLNSSLFTLRSSLNFTFCLLLLTGCFISTSNGIPFTVTLAILLQYPVFQRRNLRL